MASPAVRTAPAFTAAATERLITLNLIDASGDKRSASISVAIAATAANIEAWAAAYAAASQASLWAITETLVRKGVADADNADVLQRNSLAQGINVLFTHATLENYSERLMAPVPATLQGNQDIPLASSTELAAVITTSLALLTGYAADSTQYTERRERKNNPKVSI
jgi:hypothetical protein